MPLFKQSLLQKILAGQKTQTRRIHTCLLQIGESYGIRTNRFEKAQARIIITDRRQEKLGDITQEDARKEGFKNLEEFREVWEEIYGDWQPTQIVTVYDFALQNK